MLWVVVATAVILAPVSAHAQILCGHRSGRQNSERNEPHRYDSGRQCAERAGSTPMSWLNGLKGVPWSNLISRSAMPTRSEANGA